MSSGFEKRLEDIVQLKNEIDQAAARAKRAKLSGDQERERRKELAKSAWALAEQQIEEAIAAINGRISSVGLVLKAKPSERDVHPAIARYMVGLDDGAPTDKECKVVFNVSALGLVQPIFGIPHSGKNPAHFMLQDVDAQSYGDILADFVEQVLLYRRSKI